MQHRAIETRYKGYRFRSRLEARWAVYFDSLGLQWEYEPDGFELSSGERYLPDFKVRAPRAWLWFEVKGAAPAAEDIERMRCLTDDTGADALIVSGPIGDHVVTALTKGYVSDPWPGLMCNWLGTSPERHAAAVIAARGARFEFGAKGACRAR